MNDPGYAGPSAPPSEVAASDHYSTAMATIAGQARRTNLLRVLELSASLDRLAEGSLEPADWTAAERTAHQLAGSAGTFGFDGVSALARSLERFLGESRTTGVVERDRLARAREQLSRARDQLAAGPHLG